MDTVRPCKARREAVEVRVIPALATVLLLATACASEDDRPEEPEGWEGSKGPAEEISEAEETICAKVRGAESARALADTEARESAVALEQEAWGRAMEGGVVAEVHLLATQYPSGTPIWATEMLNWCDENIEGDEAEAPDFPEHDSPRSTPPSSESGGGDGEEAEPASYDLSIRDDGVTETHDCDGLDVEIRADDTEITLTGACGSVFLSGKGNKIQADSVAELGVTGKNNTVVCRSGGGSVTDYGEPFEEEHIPANQLMGCE